MVHRAVVKIGISGTSYEYGVGGARQDNFEVALSKILAHGTGVDQFDKVYRGVRQIAASGSESIDLAGTITGALGATFGFTEVKAILIKASSTNINDVVIGGAPAATFVGPFGAAAHTVRVRPGQIFAITATGVGWTVIEGADLLKIANSGGGSVVDYQIILLGI